MRRSLFVCAFVLFAVTVALAATRTRTVRFPSDVVGTTLGAAVSNVTADERARFNAGLNQFNARHTVANGLGPVFNDDDCRACHSAGATGGGSRTTVTRFGTTTNGAFDAMTRFGGSLIQKNALTARDVPNHPFQPETVPSGATFVTQRRSTPIFGLGLVDATPDEAFMALAEIEAIGEPSTAGHAALVSNLSTKTKTVGRFGWKAQVPTLFQFVGDALLNEMGVTSPQFPDENCPSGNCAELAFNPMPGLNDTGTAVRQIGDFVMMLAPPPRTAVTADVQAGETLFSQTGCASCHVATLTTGSSAIVALDHKIFHPYSDFLLHDMGTLGDGIEQESAKGSEIRTAPLWGLRAVQSFLHDGRAPTINQAILLHAGQGKAARDRFAALTPAEQAQVLAFLNSL